MLLRGTDMNAADINRDDFSGLLNKGKELLKKGDPAGAVKYLSEASKLKPGHDGLLNLLGMAYFRLEEHDKAEKIYLKLLESNPEVHILHTNLGLIYFKENRLEEAAEHLEKAVRIDPAHLKTRSYLGLVYQKQGRLEDALKKFREAAADNMAEKVEKELARRNLQKPNTVSPPQVQSAPVKRIADPLKMKSEAQSVLNRLSSAKPSVQRETRPAAPESDSLFIKEEKSAGEPLIPSDRDQILDEMSHIETSRPVEFDAFVDVCSTAHQEKLPEAFRFIDESTIDVTLMHEFIIQHKCPFVMTGKGRCAESEFSNRFSKCSGEGRVLLGGNGQCLYFVYVKATGFHIRMDNAVLISEGMEPYMVKAFGRDFVHISGEGYVVVKAGKGMTGLNIPAGDAAFVPPSQIVGYASLKVEGIAETGESRLVGGGEQILKITGKGALLAGRP